MTMTQRHATRSELDTGTLVTDGHEYGLLMITADGHEYYGWMGERDEVQTYYGYDPDDAVHVSDFEQYSRGR